MIRALRSSRLVRDVCLGMALLAAAGCGGGKSSSSTSSSQASADFDFGSNDSRKATAFGDSITVGVLELQRRGLGLTTRNNYPNILQARLRSFDPTWRVVNRGVGGEHSSEGAARMSSTLNLDKPGFVLIMEGTNDAHQCQDKVALINNLSSMVRAAQANKTIPIIGTIPPSFRNNACADDIITEVNLNIHSLATASGVVVAEIFDGMNHRELFGTAPDRDPLHPNEQGYQVMADVWLQAMLQAIPGGVTAALHRRR
ncbi:MAG TPA: GDSL-type esterase/lipase family protein [Methylomirabilota bacterium]|jgi:lysophospholipase L1-like esterase